MLCDADCIQMQSVSARSRVQQILGFLFAHLTLSCLSPPRRFSSALWQGVPGRRLNWRTQEKKERERARVKINTCEITLGFMKVFMSKRTEAEERQLVMEREGRKRGREILHWRIK